MELAKLDLLEAMNRYDQTVQTFMRASETVEALDRMNYTKQNLHKFEVVTFPKTKVAYTRYVSYWNANSLFIGRRAEDLLVEGSLMITVASARYMKVEVAYL